MGQYYTIINYSKKQRVNVGKFYGDFEYYIKIFNWDEDDKIVAYGDYADEIHYKDDAPEEVFQSEWNCHDVWDLCKFAAKKLSVEAQSLYNEWIENRISKDGITTIELPLHPIF